MRPKLINGKYVFTKNTWGLLDKAGKPIVNKNGDLITFSNQEEAELYLKENNIDGSVR